MPAPWGGAGTFTTVEEMSELPNLKGSAKQIKWATEIRAKVLAVIDEHSPTITNEWSQELDAKCRTQFDYEPYSLSKFPGNLISFTTARWWLDHRSKIERTITRLDVMVLIAWMGRVNDFSPSKAAKWQADQAALFDADRLKREAARRAERVRFDMICKPRLTDLQLETLRKIAVSDTCVDLHAFNQIRDLGYVALGNGISITESGALYLEYAALRKK